MSFVDERVEQYAEEHTTSGGDVFERLAAETREKSKIPEMMVGRVEGKFLEFLVRATGAQNILELGTFTGYSSISMAKGLVGTGRVVSCDVNADTTAVARRYAAEAGVADRIEYRLGPALDSLPSLDGPFDLVFVDADKVNYLNYYEALLPKLAQNGLMIFDNTLWSGEVVNDDVDETTRVIQQLNDRVRDDDRVECVLLTVRDGMLLVRRRAVD